MGMSTMRSLSLGMRAKPMMPGRQRYVTNGIPNWDYNGIWKLDRTNGSINGSQVMDTTNGISQMMHNTNGITNGSQLMHSMMHSTSGISHMMHSNSGSQVMDSNNGMVGGIQMSNQGCEAHHSIDSHMSQQMYGSAYAAPH